VAAPAVGEVTRIHLRYAQEVVEALGFCPWARDARVSGAAQTRVTFGTSVGVAAVLALLDEIEATPSIEVAFLVFPELALDRMQLSHWAAEVREADAARRPIGTTVLALADFHPEAPADTASPERLVPFIRRSPYPTLQAIRKSSLDAVRMTENQGTAFVDVSQLAYEALLQGPQTPSLAARIARNNWKTVTGQGTDALEAIFRDIARDRDETHAALGLARPPWMTGPP
jgi:hypothetical protein